MQDSCQFVKDESCKMSAGFRFCVCLLKVESHEVRGSKLNGWVDVSYNFHNRKGHYAIGGKNFQRIQFDTPTPQ